ncbi:DUF2804 domain-containing protein [Georgenia faecalis]|uniref:DUF2804 domain-containing protein n=1 Tax=Georgenia faecalis TaxID=2483799 RepID=A0ABV9DC52_9MICO|nr:DUF2804 domain-containing protein [Georgenia faecalis]
MDGGGGPRSREITEPVDLCLPSGQLNPAAVGWTRTPLHRANLLPGNARGRAATWSRTKKWEYVGIITDRHVVTVTASSLNYAGIHRVWVLDRTTGEEIDTSLTVPFAKDTHLPAVFGAGAVRVAGPRLAIAVDPAPTTNSPDALRVRAQTPRVRLDVTVAPPLGSELLGVVVPWSERQFQYAVKSVGVPASGTLTVDGAEHPVEGWASLDHGRGRWPYAITWNWGAGSGTVDGVVTGLQLGGKWTEGTGTSDNGLFLDGRLHRIDEDLAWTYDALDASAAPWRVSGERVEVELHPFHERTEATNLGVVSMRVTQAFGHWTGWVDDDHGERRRVDGLVGWAQQAVNRW